MIIIAALVPVAAGTLLSWWAWKRKPVEKAEIAQRQLTNRNASNPIVGAVISRDGRYVAYSDNNGISIQEIENGETHRLAGTSGDIVADWYPDGLRLLIVDDKHDLWTLFTATGEKRKLVSHAFNPTLSADGSQIVFFRDSTDRELWIVPSFGGEPRLQFALPEGESFLDAVLSPDGKEIADIRQVNGLNTPAVLEARSLEDGKSRALLTDPNLAGGGWNPLLWLPDGRILFGLFKGGLAESDLWAISAVASRTTAGQPVRLTNTRDPTSAD